MNQFFFYPYPVSGAELSTIASSEIVSIEEYEQVSEDLRKAEFNLEAKSEIIRELWSCLEDCEAELDEAQEMVVYLTKLIAFISQHLNDYCDDPNGQTFHRLNILNSQLNNVLATVLSEGDEPSN